MCENGQERRMEQSREGCKECPLVEGYCKEHTVLTHSWKARMNLIITLLVVLLGGTTWLLSRVDTLGDNVSSVVTGLKGHISEYDRFQIQVGEATHRLWQDVRDLRTKDNTQHGSQPSKGSAPVQ